MASLIQPNPNAFMELLPEELRGEVTGVAHISKYSDGQLIHSRGEVKPGLSIIRSGAASVGVYGADGKFVMVTELGPGESFGEFTIFTGLPRTHDIAAVGSTEVYEIPIKKFQLLYEKEPEISKALLKATLWRTHVLLEMVDAMRRLPVIEQTAKLLLSMQQAANSTSVQCKQSDLAFSLGISRVSIGKALKELAELGLIQLGYGHITIPDPSELEHWVNLQSNTVQVSKVDQKDR